MPLANLFATQLYHVLITSATMLRDRGYVLVEPSLLHEMNVAKGDIVVPSFADFKKLVMVSGNDNNSGECSFISRDMLQIFAVKAKNSNNALDEKEAKLIIAEFKSAITKVVNDAASASSATPSGITSREIARARAKASSIHVLLSKYMARPSSPALEATCVVFMTGSASGPSSSSVVNPSLSLPNVITYRSIAQSRGANRLIVVVGHDANNANVSSGGTISLIPPAIRREIETLETTIAVQVQHELQPVASGQILGDVIVKDENSSSDDEDESAAAKRLAAAKKQKAGRKSSSATTAATTTTTAAEAPPTGVTVELFEDSELLLNPLRHSNSPLDYRVITTVAEVNVLLKEKGVASISQLPRICLSDPLSRYYGLCRGNIIETLRQAHDGGIVGTHVMYRQVL